MTRLREVAQEVFRSHTALFFFSLLLSFAWVLLGRTYAFSPLENHFSFGGEMGRIAASLASGDGYSSPMPRPTGPTAFAPPVYPLLVALVFKCFGIYSLTSAKLLLFLNCVFSGLTAVALCKLGGVAPHDRAGLLAGWAWAVYPCAVYANSHVIWETSLSALLLTLLVLAAYRLRPGSSALEWIGFGAFSALAVLTNASAFVLVLVLCGWLVWKWRRSAHQPVPGRLSPSFDLQRSGLKALPDSPVLSGRSTRKGFAWLQPVSLTALGFVFLMSPWWIRNYLVIGKAIPFRTNFWLEVWVGNCFDGMIPGHGTQEDYFAYVDYHNPFFWAMEQRYPTSEHPNSQKRQNLEYARLGELNYMAEKHAASLRCISSNQASFLKLTARRFIYTWTTAMYVDLFVRYPALRVVWVAAYTSLSILAGIGMVVLWKIDAARAAPFVLSLAFFPAVYYVTHVTLRYRYPIDPQILLLAAFAIDFAWRKLVPPPRQPAELSR